MFATNVFGMVDLTNRVAPLMKAQQEGDIVNIASTSGTKGAKGATVYGEISEAGRKKMFGIAGGRLSLKFTKAEAPGGHTLNVRALAVKKSDVTQRPVDTGTRQPKDLAAAKGTEYIAYTDGEQSLSVPRR